MQVKVEKTVQRLLDNFLERLEVDQAAPRLQARETADFVRQGLSNLSQSYEV